MGGALLEKGIEMGKNRHITVVSGVNNNPKLRRANRIKTIQASLAIENNTLTVEQITGLLNGKRVLGTPVEIKEVKNAYEVYEQLLSFNPYSIGDLLKAHGILMSDLVNNAGHFRTGGVGVFKGSQVVHMAPPVEFVPKHIDNLFTWYQKSTVHPLIKRAVFHYEFEFIHPFADGNGRTGRLWHIMLLASWKEILAWIPVETLVKERQNEYYDALGKADSTIFVEFMLIALRDALKEIQVTDPVERLIYVLGDKELSSSELMRLLNLKHKYTFRNNYIKTAIQKGLIEIMIPEKPNSRNQKYRKKFI